MSEDKKLRAVFNAHADKVIELREFSEKLAKHVGTGKLSLMPDISLLDIPRLLIKAQFAKNAQRLILSQEDVQKKLAAAMGDGSYGLYYNAKPYSAFIHLDGREDRTYYTLSESDIRPDYIKLSHDVFLRDTPSLRVLAFDRFALTAMALVPSIPKEKLIPALEAALLACEDYSDSVKDGSLKAVPLQKIYNWR